ncbi:MAG: Fe(3+) ABC transporter substrate-binding protein [bacterium]|nr:MAG: Fe(3+) ABC transporter substrate-binding protein [bacterium]
MNKKSLLALTLFLVLLASTAPLRAAEVVVYSARNEHLIQPLFDRFTGETGIRVKFITDQAGALVQRIRSEGRRTQADLFITVDAGNLWYAADQGLLQPVKSPTLEENIPSHLRDPEGRWFGLSVRARTIVYSTDRVDPADLSTYEALGGPEWRGRLLLRTSKKVYNQSLVAMLIADHGVEKTERIVRSWVGNLAVDPLSNDTKVMEAILAGQGDVGIVNTYYYGRLSREDPELPLALFWPDQNGGGVHVNVSGAGVTRHARHREEAVRLLEWLSSSSAQGIFAEANLEYPANPGIEPHPAVKAWGTFKQSGMNLARAGELQGEAIRLMDRAGYR